MNILLINISLRPDSKVKLFPIGLGYIATAVKKAGFNIDIIDIDAHRYAWKNICKMIAKKKYDVVGMGCIVTGYRIIKELSQVIKEIHPNSIIIVGNSVATSIVDTLLSKTKVDIAIMGEGDITIIELLEAINSSLNIDDVKGICFLKGNSIVKTTKRPVINNISELPYVDFSLFDTEIYIQSSKEYVNDPLPIDRDLIRALPVNTARGCIGNCTFCYHNFKGERYRYRKPSSIIGEVKKLIRDYNVNYINFWDELTFYSKDYTDNFMQEIIESGLKFFWRGNCRADLFNQPEDLKIIMKMKKAGCIGASYSLESADASILKDMNKNITTQEFSLQTQMFHEVGIPVWTSLVFGYPQETQDTIRSTFDCCIKNRIYPSAGYLLPQPGSKMYDYAVQKGYININNEEEYLLKLGDRQDLRVNMTAMSNAEFEGHINEGLKRCSNELGIVIEKSNLIKTQYYRGSNDVLKR